MYHRGHHGNSRRSRSANAADIIGEQIADDAAGQDAGLRSEHECATVDVPVGGLTLRQENVPL